MEDPDTNGLIGDLVRIGTIASVDLPDATAIVDVGDITTPPLPWLEWAGYFKTWSPPSIGEQVLILCAEGDIAGGVIVRGLYSNANPAPSSGADHVIAGPAGLSITLTPDGLRIEAPGGVSLTGDLNITGNANITGTVKADTDVTANGISLKSHKHSGVQAGGAQSGGPV